MNTYTLQQLEQAVFGSAPQLTPQAPFRIDVWPEDIFVVETASDSCRWIIVLDAFSCIVVKVFSDPSIPDEALQ